MAVTLYHNGRTPGQLQFGLATFTEHYKASEAADVVLLDSGVPQQGDAHPDYPFMFVTDRHAQETGESACALDVIYMGCLADDGEGGPSLPPRQNSNGDAVQSASASKGIDGTQLSSPISVQFYAPTSKLSFLSYLGAGALGTVADPTEQIRIISVTIGDTAYSPTGPLASVVANFFRSLIIDTMESQEIVSDKYWQNGETKTNTLSGWIFSIASGDYILEYASGQNYVVGNTLTINDGMGHTAVLDVTSLGLNGSVLDWTVTSNSFDYSTTAPIYASGGSGSGAGFWAVHIP